MSVSVGIDCGGSSTKLCLLNEDLPPQFIKFPPGGDPRSVLPPRAALGLTGVRVRDADWADLPYRRLVEYKATACGARKLSGLDHILVVNCGTGTTFLCADADKTDHLGGSGIGGGMLPGLGLRLLGTADTDELCRLAEKGDLNRVDLNISDFNNTSLLSLAPDVTVANFGKLNASTRREDIALGLLNALYQTVGIMAAFAARSCGVSDIVVTGGAAIGLAQRLLDKVGELCGVRFLIPENAVFATALGAAELTAKEE